MKIFSAAQVRKWDAYTIANEPVSSVDLMERAATACFGWLSNNFIGTNNYTIFCGTGNNGGDGLAIARMLLNAGNNVGVYVLEGEKRSQDFSEQLNRLKSPAAALQFIDSTDFHVIPAGTIVIDAIFGSGLTRPLQGLVANMVNYINEACRTIISIDIPTGLFADSVSEGNTIIRATHTVSFQTPKLAFLLDENSQYTGKLHLLDIGLHPAFYITEAAIFHMTDQKDICGIYQPRNQFSHKYNFGHVLLYAGSKNMMGAAILCAKATLRSGAGLVTVFTEDSTQPIMQTALPEAITTTENELNKLIQKKSAIGIGPGLEISRKNTELLKDILLHYSRPLVIDASALQMLAEAPGLLLQRLLNRVVLTPHTGEFEKLFGKTTNDFERIHLARQKSVELNCYIVLKGHHSLVACPDGNVFFNTTGNAGMATAGSGDVLTGMLTGLLAQGYSQKNACILGVYLHGLAGDIAADRLSQEAMIAGDIIECAGEAYKKIIGICKVDD